MLLIKLSGPQRASIRDALLAAFSTREQLVGLFQAVDRRFEHLETPTASLQGNVLSAVGAAEDEDWLVGLLAKAFELRQGDLALKALLAELEPLAPPDGADLYAVCRLAGSSVMVDRSRLRDALQELDRPLGKRILVVTGAERTGKTHSTQLISYLAMMKRSFTLVTIDLESAKRMLGTDVILEPDHLADRLVNLLGYQLNLPERPTDAQWAYWVVDFCDRLEPRARREDRPVWIVIDAFDKVLLTQPTLDLVKELAARIGTSLTQFRLILLGFGEPFAPRLGGQVESEVIEPIRRRQVTEFFVKAFEQHGIPPDAHRLARATRRVLAGLDPGDANYLSHLGARASEELAKARAGTDSP